MLKLLCQPSTAEDEALAFYAPWQPEGASYYGDELVLEPVQRLTLGQRLELLDSHPLLTRRCPNCQMPILQTDSPLVVQKTFGSLMMRI